MTSARATYHDGQTGEAHPVLVRADADFVYVEGEGVELRHPLDTVALEPPLGSLPRRLDLPGRGACLVDAAFELPGSPTDRGARLDGWVHTLERRWPLAIASALALALIVWASIVLVVPFAAERVAMGVSPSVEARVAGQTLAALDRLALEPSRLPPARQAEISRRFAALSSLVAGPGAHTLEFRSSKAIGPNAFALPGGIVVILDELVAVAEHDDELSAVLAHEIGHVRGRHALRGVIQSSVSALIVASIVGDVFSASSYAAALPAVVLESRYSRGFEREADGFAVALLVSAGIDPAHFGRILLRMDGRSKKAGRYPDFLSSHPRSDERARAASPAR
jgi:Zn-dependent protease with chaperone function